MPESVATIKEGLQAKYGLPERVVFCKRCVMSNQRPSSYPEFKHGVDRQTPTLHIEDGICDACRYAEQKERIDWAGREEELLRLLDKHRRQDGAYDVLVPGSGGKDSAYAAHVLKYKYGMHPLTATWPPLFYTKIGRQNFQNWIDVGGFDNMTYGPNGHVHRLLTRLSIENLLHPFQTFILGQKNMPPKVALTQGISLVFYGENEAEFGNPIAENAVSLRQKSYYTMQHMSDIRLAGLSVRELEEQHHVSLNDISAFLPADYHTLERARLEVQYLGYYLKWTPQENYYYAIEHTGFQANPQRTEGTYSKYNSLDDCIDGFHFYTAHIKFGLGRTSYEASQETRNKHLTRADAVALVKRFDGEFPQRYFQEIMDGIGMRPERFHALCDQFRSPHLWAKERGEWQLRHPVWEQEVSCLNT